MEPNEYSIILSEKKNTCENIYHSKALLKPESSLCIVF